MSDSYCWSQRAIDSYLSPEDKKQFGEPVEGSAIPPIIQSYLEKRDPTQWLNMQNTICALESLPVCNDHSKVLASKTLRLFESLHKETTGETVMLPDPETCEDIQKILKDGMTYKTIHEESTLPQKNGPPFVTSDPPPLPVTSAPPSPRCPDGMVLSESVGCAHKPWHDYVSCEVERLQGGCDGNKWVQEHCAKTCTTLRRGLKKDVPYPFADPKSQPNFHLNDKTYNHGLVLTTAHGCTASEKVKLEMWGHEGVRIVECVGPDGRAISGTHPDSHYCNDVTTFPTFKTVENQLYPYPY